MEAVKARKKSVRAGVDGTLAINDLLKLHLDVDAETGICAYKNGWSDTVVAEVVGKEIGREITENAVQYVRTMRFGELRRTVSAKPKGLDRGDALSILSEIAEARVSVSVAATEAAAANRRLAALELRISELLGGVNAG